MSGKIEKFPTCEENCIVFLKTMANPKRALICETMRACGECPKDKWRVQATETLEKRKKISDDELTRLEVKQKKSEGSAREAITRTMYFLNGEIQTIEKVLEALKSE